MYYFKAKIDALQGGRIDKRPIRVHAGYGDWRSHGIYSAYNKDAKPLTITGFK